MEMFLRNGLYIVAIIAVILFISSVYFDFNIAEKAKESLRPEQRHTNQWAEVDGVWLRVDSPTVIENRFKGISTTSIEVFENATVDLVAVGFTDTSGYLNDKCYRITQYSGHGTLCNVCSNKTAGILHCEIRNWNGGSLFGSFWAEGGGSLSIPDNQELRPLLESYYVAKYGNGSLE